MLETCSLWRALSQNSSEEEVHRQLPSILRRRGRWMKSSQKGKPHSAALKQVGRQTRGGFAKAAGSSKGNTRCVGIGRAGPEGSGPDRSVYNLQMSKRGRFPWPEGSLESGQHTAFSLIFVFLPWIFHFLNASLRPSRSFSWPFVIHVWSRHCHK